MYGDCYQTGSGIKKPMSETSFVGVIQLEPGEFVLLRDLNTFFIILFIFRTFVCF